MQQEKAAGAPGAGERRAWELELVISGALIVALFKIPSILDSGFNRVINHVSDEIHFLPILGLYVGSLMIYALIATFLSHFFLRSFWVGLIGLESVFKGGIDWEGLKLTPFLEKFYRSHHFNIHTMQHAIDRLCSTLFSILFIMLAIFLWIGTIILCFCLPLAYVLKLGPFSHMSLNFLVMACFYSILFLILSPALFVRIVEKLKHDQPDWDRHEPRLAALCMLCLKINYMCTASFIYEPIVFVFKSRLPTKKVQAGLFLLIISFPTVFLTVFILKRSLDFNSYRFFPQAGKSYTVETDSYDNLREPGKVFFRPSIQADIIQDPYLRLFLPFRALKDNARVAALCPELQAHQPDGFFFRMDEEQDIPGEQLQKTLKCLAATYRISLNGEVLNALTFNFYVHPQTKIRGLLTYIPCTSQPSGRNLLHVKKLGTLQEGSEHSDLNEKDYYLPFYR